MWNRASWSEDTSRTIVLHIGKAEVPQMMRIVKVQRYIASTRIVEVKLWFSYSVRAGMSHDVAGPME